MRSCASNITVKKMDYLEYIQNKVNRGIWSFSSKEMADILGIPPKDKLTTLRRRGRIISPARGFYVIVPEEYIHSGRLPVDRYIDQMMNYLSLPYYVGLLTAASYYGSSHQSPQSFQVMTTIDKRNIRIAKNQILFFRKKNADMIPGMKRKTATGYFNISTPEATFLDMVEFYRQLGGLGHVGLVISEMVDQLSPQAIGNVAQYYTNAVVQRGAYLLELLNQQRCCEILDVYFSNRRTIYTYLNPSGNQDRANRNPRWKLIINETINIEP